jgi:hypothetical protein
MKGKRRHEKAPLAEEAGEGSAGELQLRCLPGDYFRVVRKFRGSFTDGGISSAYFWWGFGVLRPAPKFQQSSKAAFRCFVSGMYSAHSDAGLMKACAAW